MLEIVLFLGLFCTIVVLHLISISVFLVILPLIFLGIVTIFVAEFIGSGNSRRHWGRLELPIVTLTHRESGRKVRLIGVMHIADAPYWQKIQHYVDQSQSIVLYEGISKVTDEEAALFTVEERVCHKQLEMLSTIMRGEFATLLGLQYQKEGLAYPPHWIRTDMSGAELIQRLANKNDDLLEGLGSLGKLTDGERPLVAILVQLILSHITLMELYRKLFPEQITKETWKRVIIEERNLIGFQGIITHASKHDVVAIWGAGHLPGLQKLLTDAGYHMTKKEWLPAWKIKHLSFIRSLVGARKKKKEQTA